MSYTEKAQLASRSSSALFDGTVTTSSSSQDQDPWLGSAAWTCGSSTRIRLRLPLGSSTNRQHLSAADQHLSNHRRRAQFGGCGVRLRRGRSLPLHEEVAGRKSCMGLFGRIDCENPPFLPGVRGGSTRYQGAAALRLYFSRSCGRRDISDLLNWVITVDILGSRDTRSHP